MAEAPASVEVIKDSVDDILMLSELREEGKAELLDILSQIRGRKCLVVDVQLGGLINQIVLEGSRFLKDHGVQHFRELKGELGDFSSDAPENIIYLVRPNLSLMKLIAQQIKESITRGIKSQFHICFVPSQSTVCMHLLESQINNREVWDKITFGEFRLGLIPFDSDILSLEMDGVFKQCYVDGDLSSLNIIALALLKMQTIYGVIPNIKSKGLGAKKVLQKLLRMRVEEEDKEQQQQQGFNSLSPGTSTAHHNADKYSQRSEIDTLVIIDREVDLISPLVTPLTYEGLVDDIIGIENSRIRLDAAVLGEQEDLSANLPNINSVAGQKVAPPQAVARKPGEKVSVALNNNDSVYSEIRDLSIERLGSFLQEKAMHIRERYTTFKENKDAPLTVIHDFVKKLPKLQADFKSLNQHINIAELVKTRTDSKEFRDQWQGERGMLEGESFLDAIEDMVCADVDRTLLFRVLRLLCMQSVTSGGIRSNRYDVIRKAIGQNYGLQHLFTLSNLERAGLLRRKDVILVDAAPVWQTLRKQLKLIDERVNMSRPDDISYVSAGYAPLLVRLVQSLSSTNNSWAAMGDIMKLLPGPLLEFTQTVYPEELDEALARSASEAATAASVSASATFGSSSLTPSALLSYTTGIMASASDLGRKNSQSVAVGSTAYTNLLSGMGDMKLFDDHTMEKKTMVVFVVGGLSFMEIAAFRFISRDPAFPFKIILATTKLVNGTSFLGSMQHTFC